MAVPTDDELVRLARTVIQAEARAVGAVESALGDTFVQVSRLLAACTGKVLVTGSGTSGAVARRAAHLLSVCGTPAFYLAPADGLHGGLGVLQPNDLLLALSKGGGSDELNEFCRRAKTLCSGIIAVTAAHGSALTAAADHVLYLTFDDDADLGNVVATGSSLAVGALIDALAATGKVARGYSWERLLFTHPAGAVGRDHPQGVAGQATVRGN